MNPLKKNIGTYYSENVDTKINKAKCYIMQIHI